MKPQQKAWAHEANDEEPKCAEQKSKELAEPNKPADRGMCEKETAVQGSEFATSRN